MAPEQGRWSCEPLKRHSGRSDEHAVGDVAGDADAAPAPAPGLERDDAGRADAADAEFAVGPKAHRPQQGAIGLVELRFGELGPAGPA